MPGVYTFDNGVSPSKSTRVENYLYGDKLAYENYVYGGYIDHVTLYELEDETAKQSYLVQSLVQ